MKLMLPEIGTCVSYSLLLIYEFNPWSWDYYAKEVWVMLIRPFQIIYSFIWIQVGLVLFSPVWVGVWQFPVTSHCSPQMEPLTYMSIWHLFMTWKKNGRIEPDQLPRKSLTFLISLTYQSPFVPFLSVSTLDFILLLL